ncbi:MAG: hypothetical protein DMF71_15035 [Acidobacteria bacterium]|nr:MAG: hypothetical protein DMF71_15035 [Acidobacteriota bacterium]
MWNEGFLLERACFAQSTKLEKTVQNGVAASPPDVRKGFAFPAGLDFVFTSNFRRGCASPKVGGHTKRLVSESRRLSAHQAAKPRNDHACIRKL